MLEQNIITEKSLETTYVNILHFKGHAVSINNKYTLMRSRSQIILSQEYRLFQSELFYSIKSQHRNLKIDPPYSVKIEFITYKDVDALIKPTLDCLTKAGIITDDKDVLELIVKKIPVKKGSEDVIILAIKQIKLSENN